VIGPWREAVTGLESSNVVWQPGAAVAAPAHASAGGICLRGRRVQPGRVRVGLRTRNLGLPRSAAASPGTGTGPMRALPRHHTCTV